MTTPLSGPKEWRGTGGEVRALDLTSGAAGGFATLLLAEMGFEVT